MTTLRHFLIACSIALGWCNTAQAGIPVIDSSNLGQAILQVQAWAQQYQQMVQQLQQAQQQFNALSGVRNMGSLVNKPASRSYLPSDYASILSQGVGQWAAIRNAAKKFDVTLTSLSPPATAPRPSTRWPSRPR